MTIEELSRFVEAANSGSFSSAAEKLNISAQGLGQSVRQLERDLGVELLVKNPQGVVLTREGRHIYECSVEIMRKTDEIRRIAANVGKDTIHLKFAYRNSAIGRSMEEIIRGLQPGFDLDAEFLNCSNFASLQECYSAPGVNVLFTFGGSRDIPGNQDWVPVKLFEYNVYPIINSEGPLAKKGCLTPEDIGNMIIALTSEGVLSRVVIEDFLSKYSITSPKISCTSNKYCAELVERNQNIVCFIPYSQRNRYVSLDRKLKLMDLTDCPKMIYTAYVRREIEQNEALNALLDKLRETYVPTDYPL